MPGGPMSKAAKKDGQGVAATREALGVTQGEFGELLGLSKSSVQKWEKTGVVRLMPLQRELYAVARAAAQRFNDRNRTILKMAFSVHGVLEAVVFLMSFRGKEEL